MPRDSGETIFAARHQSVSQGPLVFGEHAHVGVAQSEAASKNLGENTMTADMSALESWVAEHGQEQVLFAHGALCPHLLPVTRSTWLGHIVLTWPMKTIHNMGWRFYQ